jgi:hypothetical protein
MGNSIDLKYVQQTYAEMHDEELVHFARNEGLKLSVDAFLILRDECRKRNIGLEIIQQVEQEVILQDSLRRQRLAEDMQGHLYNDAIRLMLNQKHKQVSNYDIYAGLIELGIDEEQANYLVNRLDDYTTDLRADAIIDIQTGLALFLLGLIVFYIALQMQHFYIGAIMLLLVGVVRVMVSLIKKQKYERILEIIHLENEIRDKIH